MAVTFRRLLVVAWIFALIAAPLSASKAADPEPYVGTTGVGLHAACGGAAPHVCLSYIAGVIDMHEAGLSGNAVSLFCPLNVPPEKVGRGIWLYFEQNPEALDQPAVFGAVQALALMFPCS
jgi:hypothetical protein